MQVFYSPDGDVVSRDEATSKNIEITSANRERLSRRELKKMIDDLSDALCYVGEYSDCTHDFEELSEALRQVAGESEFKYRAGSKVLRDSIRNSKHFNYWDNMHWAMALLGDSGHHEAIEPLIEMCNIDNEGLDHYDDLKSIAEGAVDALGRILEENPELRLQVWSRVLNTRYPSVRISAASRLAELGDPGAVTSLNEVLREGEGYRRDEINQAARNALKKLQSELGTDGGIHDE